ncbi:MAG: hypothetical protein ISS45_04905 [Candidatus Omnitrophica bacterium]|nr:hypothetical protein [Candidatus Omnitrophota bacterium]
MKLRRCFIKVNFFVILILIIGLGSNVIVLAEADIKNKLLSNITILKERIKELEKMVNEGRLGELKEKVSQIKDELDRMVGNKTVEQIEKERDKAGGETKGSRIKEIEKRLEEKAYKEKERDRNKAVK